MQVQEQEDLVQNKSLPFIQSVCALPISTYISFSKCTRGIEVAPCIVYCTAVNPVRILQQKGRKESPESIKHLACPKERNKTKQNKYQITVSKVPS
jgi:hypothetical protein